MTKVKQSVGSFVASFFGKSEKVISEKLTTEEHNQFTTEATELQTKITNLEGERDTLQASVTQLEGEKTTLASANTTLEGEKTALQGKLTTAETDRDKYKAWFEKQAGVGAELPALDETSKNGPQLTSYNQSALETFRKAKGL